MLPRVTASVGRGATVMTAVAVIATAVVVTATAADVTATAVSIVIALQRRPSRPRATRPCRS